MVTASQRRLGLILGLALGLEYSVASKLINSFLLPGIPFFAPWPGNFWLIALSTAMFGALGLLAAWTEDSLPGVILSALFGTLISSIWVIATDSTNRIGAFVVLFFIFLPRVFLYLPFSVLVRWLISKIQQRPYGDDVALPRRLLPLLLSFVVVIFIGTFIRVTEQEKKSLLKMQELVQAGLTVSSRDELPDPLQDVNGFIEKGKGEYTFDLGPNPDVLPVQRPIVDYGVPEPFIIVRFENGFRFGCVFSPPYVVPACIDF